MDGTLIDSNDAHTRSWLDVLTEAGFDVHYHQVRPLIGMGGDKLVRKLTGLDVDVGRGKELTERRGKRFQREYLPTLRPFRGAHELVARMRYEGLRLVVATSAQESEMNALLEQAGLADLIEHRTSSDDAEHSKPDPDIVKSALARFRLDADEAMMIGDTPYDIEAGGRAGLATIAFRCGGWWLDAELSGAKEIYDGPAELARRYDESLLGSHRPLPL